MNSVNQIAEVLCRILAQLNDVYCVYYTLKFTCNCIASLYRSLVEYNRLHCIVYNVHNVPFR